ncbi:MAG: hypothetical protein PWQ77_1773, partial [Kosmotogales bacterium]|nr:hypothetical protein [Kosmotogales bacterium]
MRRFFLKSTKIFLFLFVFLSFQFLFFSDAVSLDLFSNNYDYLDRVYDPPDIDNLESGRGLLAYDPPDIDNLESGR